MESSLLDITSKVHYLLEPNESIIDISKVFMVHNYLNAKSIYDVNILKEF